LTKYVDDLFAVVKKQQVNNILDILNSFNKNTKFKNEINEEEKINYLDITVHRNNNKLKIYWYKKLTASGRLTNYFSKHPKTMIINTSLSCINRMLTLCDQIFHEDIKKEVN